MREFIALTMIGLSSVIALCCALALVPRRSHGRHSDRLPKRYPSPLAGDVWLREWPTPEPVHVAARSIPITEERPPLSFRAAVVTAPLVTDDVTVELHAIKERQIAAQLATQGIDYPYSYAGAPFPRASFAAAGDSV